MGANYSEIQELLQQRADIQARLNLIPYDGNPEIKEVNGAKCEPLEVIGAFLKERCWKNF